MAIDRSRAELGFSPKVTFEEGLSATIDWYRENQAWCSAVESDSHRRHLAQNYAGRAEATAGAAS